MPSIHSNEQNSILEIPFYYFSASGNTKYCLDLVKKGFEARRINIILKEIKNINNFEFPNENSKIFGLGYPIYEFMLPRIILLWLKKLPPATNKTKVVLLSTSGGVPASSSEIAKIYLKRKNCEVMGLLEVPTPTAEPLFSNELYNARWHPDILARCFYFGYLIGKHIQENNIHYIDFQFGKYRMSLLTIYCYQYIIQNKATMKGMLKLDRNKCVKCRICIRNCPMQTIISDLNNSYPKIIEENCMLCGTCLRSCPKQALSISYRPKAIIPKSNIAPMTRPGYVSPTKYLPPKRIHFKRSALLILLDMLKKGTK